MIYTISKQLTTIINRGDELQKGTATSHWSQKAIGTI